MAQTLLAHCPAPGIWPIDPSRLLGAFPEGVTVERLGLKDAVARTREFLTR
jgi:hypothetical protein